MHPQEQELVPLDRDRAAEEKAVSFEGPALLSQLFTRYRRKPLQRAIGMFGYGCGLASALYEWNFSADFAKSICSENIRNSPLGLFTVQAFFVVHSYFPTVGLISPLTRDYLMNLADDSEIEVYEPQTNHPNIHITLWAATGTLAAFSAIPFTYQLGVIYTGNVPMQVITGIGSVVTCYVTSKLGTEGFYLQRFLNRYGQEAQLIKEARLRLSVIFEDYLAKLYRAEEKSIRPLYGKYLEMKTQQKFDPRIFALLKKELSSVVLPPPVVLSQNFTRLKFLVDLISVGLGTAATYTLYDLTLIALDWFYGAVSLQGEDYSFFAGLSYPLAVMATIPLCLFVGSFSQMRCEDYFNALTQKDFHMNKETSWPRLRRFINYDSLVIGGVAAGPNTYLSILEGDNWAGILFAFLGFALGLAKAIDILLQEWINAYDERFAQESLGYQRDCLINLVSFLLNQVQTQLAPADVLKLEAAVLQAEHSQDLEAQSQRGRQSPLQAHHFHASSRTQSPRQSVSAPSVNDQDSQTARESPQEGQVFPAMK